MVAWGVNGLARIPFAIEWLQQTAGMGTGHWIWIKAGFHWVCLAGMVVGGIGIIGRCLPVMKVGLAALLAEAAMSLTGLPWAVGLALGLISHTALPFPNHMDLPPGLWILTRWIVLEMVLGEIVILGLAAWWLWRRIAAVSAAD
jgi:hypothetical protein